MYIVVIVTPYQLTPGGGGGMFSYLTWFYLDHVDERIVEKQDKPYMLVIIQKRDPPPPNLNKLYYVLHIFVCNCDPISMDISTMAIKIGIFWTAIKF